MNMSVDSSEGRPSGLEGNFSSPRQNYIVHFPSEASSFLPSTSAVIPVSPILLPIYLAYLSTNAKIAPPLCSSNWWGCLVAFIPSFPLINRAPFSLFDPPLMPITLFILLPCRCLLPTTPCCTLVRSREPADLHLLAISAPLLVSRLLIDVSLPLHGT
ncbi:hypothetical protein HGRIS_005192 [Hohenbuehelia grisea]|uniref:Uncharacterized protein n=1 Tax=Hohenbuehelia grisea TaxID=104357 RepID=A0ABR3JF91_9AGAR